MPSMVMLIVMMPSMVMIIMMPSVVMPTMMMMMIFVVMMVVMMMMTFVQMMMVIVFALVFMMTTFHDDIVALLVIRTDHNVFTPMIFEDNVGVTFVASADISHPKSHHHNQQKDGRHVHQALHCWPTIESKRMHWRIATSWSRKNGLTTESQSIWSGLDFVSNWVSYWFCSVSFILHAICLPSCLLTFVPILLTLDDLRSDHITSTLPLSYA